MSPEDVLKWRANFAMSSEGLVGIHHFVKETRLSKKTILSRDELERAHRDSIPAATPSQ
jgi:hypothetical protein